MRERGQPQRDIKAMPPVKNPNFWKVEEKGRKDPVQEIGKGMEGISIEKEECREPQKRAPNPFRVLNLSGKLGFLTGGITFN